MLKSVEKMSILYLILFKLENNVRELYIIFNDSYSQYNNNKLRG